MVLCRNFLQLFDEKPFEDDPFIPVITAGTKEKRDHGQKICVKGCCPIISEVLYPGQPSDIRTPLVWILILCSFIQSAFDHWEEYGVQPVLLLKDSVTEALTL